MAAATEAVWVHAVGEVVGTKDGPNLLIEEILAALNPRPAVLVVDDDDTIVVVKGTRRAVVHRLGTSPNLFDGAINIHETIFLQQAETFNCSPILRLLKTSCGLAVLSVSPRASKYIITHLSIKVNIGDPTGNRTPLPSLRRMCPNR